MQQPCLCGTAKKILKGYTMKSRVSFIVLVAAAIVFAVTFNHSRAAQTAPATSKMGIVSVQKIFKECKRSAAYRDKVTEERRQMENDLDRLNKEIELDKAGLKALKTDSPDYLALMKEILTKTANYQAQQKFYEQQTGIAEQNMIETLYKDIMAVTAEVGKEKGFDIVFERSAPELPASSGNELTLAISTHKVLYDAGCTDITADVMAKLDAPQK
jgi:Skp family chaperone for outer membrane proteins